MEGVTFDDMSYGDCQLDGIITPCSMVNRLMGMGAVQAEARYHNSRLGFYYHRQDFDQALPGRRSSDIFFPDSFESRYMTEGGYNRVVSQSSTGTWFNSTINSEGDIQFGETVRVTREQMPWIVKRVSEFLNENRDCEDFINALLKQTEKDHNVDLGGDLRHFLYQFSLFGNLSITPILTKNTGAGGQASPFNEDGMAISLQTVSHSFELNVIVFLHELIHAIGTAYGAKPMNSTPRAALVNATTGDKQLADAVYRMNLMKMSPEEFYKSHTDSENRTNVPASNYWKDTLYYACRNLTYKPRLMR